MNSTAQIHPAPSLIGRAGGESSLISHYFPQLTEQQLSHFAALDALYHDWNAKINVISRKDIDNLYEHHVLHSLGIAEIINFRPGTRVMDLGTGGGFPGIPLAVLFPDAHFTLCDSVGKKTLVAAEVAKALSLENAEIVNARAESLGRGFDYVVSRAVAPLPDLLKWSWKHCRKGMLCLKGGDIAEETAVAMGRFRLPAGSVHVWPVSAWQSGSWFEGKLVIHIEK